MMQAQFESSATAERWLHERHRFDVLERVFLCSAGDCSRVVACGRLSDELDLSREETFRILHDLELRGFLAYVGSGPRVRVLPYAVEYLMLAAGRRRSIRDREDPLPS